MKIAVTKLDAAKRQVDSAIRLLFIDADPVVIHTLAMAGFSIINDIAQVSDIKTLRITDYVRPEMERKFWEAVKGTANFLKHADKDPEGVVTFDDEKTTLA